MTVESGSRQSEECEFVDGCLVAESFRWAFGGKLYSESVPEGGFVPRSGLKLPK